MPTALLQEAVSAPITPDQIARSRSIVDGTAPSLLESGFHGYVTPGGSGGDFTRKALEKYTAEHTDTDKPPAGEIDRPTLDALEKAIGSLTAPKSYAAPTRNLDGSHVDTSELVTHYGSFEGGVRVKKYPGSAYTETAKTSLPAQSAGGDDLRGRLSTLDVRGVWEVSEQSDSSAPESHANEIPSPDSISAEIIEAQSPLVEEEVFPDYPLPEAAQPLAVEAPPVKGGRWVTARRWGKNVLALTFGATIGGPAAFLGWTTFGQDASANTHSAGDVGANVAEALAFNDEFPADPVVVNLPASASVGERVGAAVGSFESAPVTGTKTPAQIVAEAVEKAISNQPPPEKDVTDGGAVGSAVESGAGQVKVAEKFESPPSASIPPRNLPGHV